MVTNKVASSCKSKGMTTVEDDFVIDENTEGVKRGNRQGHRGRQEERARRDGSIGNL